MENVEFFLRKGKQNLIQLLFSQSVNVFKRMPEEL